ncbi:MAG: hypothetical protein ABR863_11965 [Roseiarcus sp.]|jgi:hypothetical protein
MSCEWTNILIQIVIAATQLVIAAAAVYTAYIASVRYTSPDDAYSKDAEEKKNCNQHTSEVSKLPTIGQQDDYVNAMVEFVRRASEERSKLFDAYPRTLNQIAMKSIAITLGGAVALSLLVSVVFNVFFPSIGSLIAMPFSIIALLASLVVWWRVVNDRTNKAWRHMYSNVDQTENSFKKTLAELAREPRFAPEMALSLHDNLLRNSPLIWYPMIFLTDRVIFEEFLRRLAPPGQTQN